ncbi:MAG: cell wall hydrolase, partial [Alphaproteobacteria bacterium]|nr:cell wall hydrolase [Alphaproteobacteria bacterium]
AWMMSKRVANLVQANWLPDTTESATHYHATYVRPYWSDKLDRTKRVGRHIFYREELSAAFRESLGEADLAQDTVVRDDLAQ